MGKVCGAGGLELIVGKKDALFWERRLAGERPVKSHYLDLVAMVWDLLLRTSFSRRSQLVVQYRTDKHLSFVAVLPRDVSSSEKGLAQARNQMNRHSRSCFANCASVCKDTELQWPPQNRR